MKRSIRYLAGLLIMGGTVLCQAAAGNRNSYCLPLRVWGACADAILNTLQNPGTIVRTLYGTCTQKFNAWQTNRRTIDRAREIERAAFENTILEEQMYVESGSPQHFKRDPRFAVTKQEWKTFHDKSMEKYTRPPVDQSVIEASGQRAATEPNNKLKFVHQLIQVSLICEDRIRESNRKKAPQQEANLKVLRETCDLPQELDKP